MLNSVVSEMGLFTLLSCFLKSQLEFYSRLPIPMFFGSHCIFLRKGTRKSGILSTVWGKTTYLRKICGNDFWKWERSKFFFIIYIPTLLINITELFCSDFTAAAPNGTCSQTIRSSWAALDRVADKANNTGNFTGWFMLYYNTGWSYQTTGRFTS